MPPRARLAPLLLPVLLAACGPGRAEIRADVEKAGHRTLAVFPFDYRGGERNAAPRAADALERLLRADGFRVYDRGKTRNVYARSLDARAGAYDAVMRTAELGAALGVSAVVTGAADGAYDRVEGRGSMRRRAAGATVLVRVVESGSGRILWETRYSASLEGFGLPQVVDQIVDVIHQQLLDALAQGRL